MKYNVFIHQVPKMVKKTLNVFSGTLEKKEDRWELVWGNRKHILTNEDVHLLTLGGTVNIKNMGRLSISTEPAIGGSLTALLNSLIYSKEQNPRRSVCPMP